MDFSSSLGQNEKYIWFQHIIRKGVFEVLSVNEGGKKAIYKGLFLKITQNINSE